MHSLELNTGLPLRAENAGLFVSRGEGVHPNRVIGSHELIFVREGALGIREEERVFEVEAGQSLLLWPGRRHMGTRPYPPDLSFYWVHFVLGNKRSRGTDQVISVPQHATVSRPNHLSEIFRRFLDDQEEGRLRPVSASLLVMLMLCEVSGSEPAKNSLESGDAVLAGRADAYIRTHFHTPSLCTSVLAENLGCNPDYLGRVYRKAYERTPTQAIHWRRVRHARRMLIESDRNVEEIARACGFKDVRYFRRIFKRHEGLAPLAFRRLYAQMHVNTE